MAEITSLLRKHTYYWYRGFESLSHRHLLNALIAQLDRALGYELRGREFESLCAPSKIERIAEKHTSYALIAQLDRALGYELRGREFESL